MTWKNVIPDAPLRNEVALVFYKQLNDLVPKTGISLKKKINLPAKNYLEKSFLKEFFVPGSLRLLEL